MIHRKEPSGLRQIENLAPLHEFPETHLAAFSEGVQDRIERTHFERRHDSRLNQLDGRTEEPLATGVERSLPYRRLHVARLEAEHGVGEEATVVRRTHPGRLNVDTGCFQEFDEHQALTWNVKPPMSPWQKATKVVRTVLFW